MQWDQLYKKSYHNSSDIPPGGLHGVIATIQVEDVNGKGLPGDIKPVLYLHGDDKGFVLNRTNGLQICEAYGPLTENAIGQEIKTTRARVMSGGRLGPTVKSTPLPPLDPDKTVPMPGQR